VRANYYRNVIAPPQPSRLLVVQYMLSMRIPSGTLYPIYIYIYIYIEAPKYYIGHYWMPIDAVRVGEGQ
jgi:hypothetical protein